MQLSLGERALVFLSGQKLPKANITPKNIAQKKYQTIKVALAIFLLIHCRPLFLICPSFVMGCHVVPAIVVDAYRTRPAPRNNWKDGYIKPINDWARQHGVLGAVQQHQKGDETEHNLSYQTIYGWLKYF